MQKKSKKNFILILILAIILLVILIFMLPLKTEEENQENSENKKITVEEEASTVWTEGNEGMCIPLGSDVNIIGINSYIGAYVEDGTDEFVENIMMLTLENKGEKNVQLAKVTLNDTYIFELTTLLPGEKIIVLEKNRAEYDEELVITSAEISSVALFDESPSMHEELLEITGEDSMIKITNVSGEDFSGGKLFYKNVLDDYYLGGITYSGTIPALKAGETVKLSANHYFKDSSEFVFVTYAE